MVLLHTLSGVMEFATVLAAGGTRVPELFSWNILGEVRILQATISVWRRTHDTVYGISITVVWWWICPKKGRPADEIALLPRSAVACHVVHGAKRRIS
jgi:hypothetical protein